MGAREHVEALVREVLENLGLTYTVNNVFQPSKGAQVWCIDFLDESAKSEDARRFQISVGPVTESTRDSVKAELMRTFFGPSRAPS